MPNGRNAFTARRTSFRDLRRLTADGWRLTEHWIEPDPWSWVYRMTQLRPGVLARLAVLLVLDLAVLTGCTHVPSVPPIVVPPPVVLVVLPIRHELSAFLDDDVVCVHTPPVQAVYVHQRCL